MDFYFSWLSVKRPGCARPDAGGCGWVSAQVCQLAGIKHLDSSGDSRSAFEPVVADELVEPGAACRFYFRRLSEIKMPPATRARGADIAKIFDESIH